MKEIIEDLKKRGMEVTGFIVVNEDGRIQVVSYDSKGNARFLSEEADCITVNKSLGGNMVRVIAEIGPKNISTIQGG